VICGLRSDVRHLEGVGAEVVQLLLARRVGGEEVPAGPHGAVCGDDLFGLVVDKGQLDDNGFNELAFRGVQRAEKELDVKGRVIESASAADYIPNMTSLARQGYDLVIGVGFALLAFSYLGIRVLGSMA